MYVYYTCIYIRLFNNCVVYFLQNMARKVRTYVSIICMHVCVCTCTYNYIDGVRCVMSMQCMCVYVEAFVCMSSRAESRKHN